MEVSTLMSGGQTGADRAALDVAVRLGLRYGGWCPRGGWAEDSVEPPGVLAAYPALRECPHADPAVRTAWNVRDSDATLVLSLGDPVVSPGTALTLRIAEELGRPHAAMRVDGVPDVASWLSAVPGTSLNVAGPRESDEPGLYAAAYGTLLALLSRPLHGG